MIHALGFERDFARLKDYQKQVEKPVKLV